MALGLGERAALQRVGREPDEADPEVGLGAGPLHELVRLAQDDLMRDEVAAGPGLRVRQRHRVGDERGIAGRLGYGDAFLEEQVGALVDPRDEPALAEQPDEDLARARLPRGFDDAVQPRDRLRSPFDVVAGERGEALSLDALGHRQSDRLADLGGA